MVYQYRAPTPPQWACVGVGASATAPRLFVAGPGTSWMLVGCGRRVKQRDDRHMALARASWGPILDAAFTCSQRPGRLLFCPSEVEKDKPC